ncbi:tetratricopeptide repeat protein [Microbulbifer variabilis]|uniref:tetratricopeptide repeat protein n=1 Tax=Microbulbifer variabilis TaxID=266805 RepID=UPI001CFD9264|nr:hypothetical protein [Microbulbifer variabilis]
MKSFNIKYRLKIFAAAISLAVSPLLWADPSNDAVVELQKAWAQIKYQTPEQEQEDAFEVLAQQAKTYTSHDPQNASLWVWRGIIDASYAGAKGGLGALSLAKAAKADLEHAIAIDGSVLDGAAFTSLGSLYYQVPGWPLGFGDDKKADEYLRKGLQFGATDIDANYFYADYLFQKKNYAQAMDYLQKALAAPADPERQVADQGRRGEIQVLMTKVQEKLR